MVRSVSHDQQMRAEAQKLAGIIGVGGGGGGDGLAPLGANALPLDCKIAGNTATVLDVSTLVPPGEVIPTHVVLVARDINGFVDLPEIKLGSNPAHDDILASVVPAGLDATGKTYQIPLLGVVPALTAGVVTVEVVTASNSAGYEVEVRLYGEVNP